MTTPETTIGSSVTVRSPTEEDIPGMTICYQDGFGAKTVHGGIPADKVIEFQTFFLQRSLTAFNTHYAVAVDDETGAVLGYCHILLPGEEEGSNIEVSWAEWKNLCGGTTWKAMKAMPLAMMSQKAPKDAVQLESITAAAAARGRGVGSRLMDWVKTRTQEHFEGVKDAESASVVLSVMYGNPAKHLYERAGFVDESTTGWMSRKFIKWVFGSKGADTMRCTWKLSDGPVYLKKGKEDPVKATELPESVATSDDASGVGGDDGGGEENKAPEAVETSEAFELPGQVGGTVQ